MAILLIIAALAGCERVNQNDTASRPAQVALAPIPTDPAAGPSGMDALTWMFDGPEQNGAGRPRLMYSARASDEMGLNLQCSGDSVQVLIVRNAPDVVPETWSFSLLSGPHAAELNGETEGEPASEMFVRAQLALASPVLTNLHDTGAISLRDGGEVRVYDAINAQERDEIARFFEACA